MSILPFAGSPKLTIPQYELIDPLNPQPQDAWVLHTPATGSIVTGNPIGLLLSLTYPSNLAAVPEKYQLSYRTKQNTTLRATIA